MIVCTSIAFEDDILDTVFTNEVDDDDGIFIFNDFVLLLDLLLLSILAIITKTSLFLSIYFNKPTCL
jgi:hypothetical protein